MEEQLFFKILATGYNISLLIDDSKLDKNFYALQETKEEIENFTHDDLINDWLIERVRRFNCSAVLLVDSITNAVNLQIYLLNNKELQNKNVIEALIRRELRNICINTEIYFEKIIALCKYYFYIDAKKVKKINSFIDVLSQFSVLHESVETFLSHCESIFKNKDSKYSDLQYINSVRNDEVHNESPLDLHSYHFDEARVNEGIFILDYGFKISNEEMFQKIYNVICIMIETKNKMQMMLENVKPMKIVGFINSNNLNKVLIPKQRSKIENPLIVQKGDI